jgi:DNA-directed RNA polymerase specialized sigma24 family protein
MESAPLRPLPRRPSEPLDPAAAVGQVARRLPDLDDPAARALALVELAGRSRELVATELGLSSAEVGDAVARGQ